MKTLLFLPAHLYRPFWPASWPLSSIFWKLCGETINEKDFFFFSNGKEKIISICFWFIRWFYIEVVSNCVELSLNFSSKFAEEVSLELSVKSVKLSRERWYFFLGDSNNVFVVRFQLIFREIFFTCSVNCHKIFLTLKSWTCTAEL